MVEESMGLLGIDSHCFDTRVTTGQEQERSTTKLLATSWNLTAVILQAYI